jgi:hypothetical protein
MKRTLSLVMLGHGNGSIVSLQIPQTKTSYIHSSHISKVSIKETIQYIKDRTENFDDYFSFM